MRRLPTLLALSLAFGACVGTSVPQPPNHESVDPERLTSDRLERGGTVSLVGLPGAAEPETWLWTWDLETADPPIVVRVDAAGAFVVDLPVAVGALRLQTRSETGRSEPVDVLPAPEGAILAPRDPCFEVPRELLLRDRAAALPLVSSCDEDVSVLEARLRATTDFEVEAPADLRVPIGERRTIQLNAPGAEPAEDILLLTVSIRGSPFRYPVTLVAD